MTPGGNRRPPSPANFPEWATCATGRRRSFGIRRWINCRPDRFADNNLICFNQKPESRRIRCPGVSTNNDLSGPPGRLLLGTGKGIGSDRTIWCSVHSIAVSGEFSAVSN